MADPVTSGRAALADHAWELARQHFEAALSRQESPEAFEGLSWAAWWLSDADALFEAREHAYRGYQAAGRSRDAARMAMWLGTDSVDFRGELALAEGWFGRARRLLEGSESSAEHGWLCVHEAEQRLFADQTEHARVLGDEATRLGRQHGTVDLEMMGLATVGLALVTEGAVDEGISRLGEAAAAALADDFSELWSAGWCCCYMLYGCGRVRDYDRATQWCRRVEAWAERMQIDSINRTCRAHYADVLIWRGTWSEAEATLVEAAMRLAEVRPPWAVAAQVRLGELRRRQGRLAEATEIFDAAAEHPLALLGIGELCLDHDDPTGAVDRAEQYLREIPPSSPTQRAAGLELLVRASVALGDLSRATVALDELCAAADRVSTNPLRASAAFCRGLVASAEGGREQARVAFEDAVRLFQRSGAPFETARAQVALTRELAELGREGEALRQGRAAGHAFHRIGAAHEAKRADALVHDLDDQQSRTASPLTRRELEVLRLVAQGDTNRTIAETLVVSEHTVNRHVTNILGKLQVTSRSAAVAEALRRSLI